MSTIAIAGAGPMLGMSIARAFGKQGYRVAVIARRREALDAMAADLHAEGVNAAGFIADLRSEEQMNTAVAAAVTRFGPIDILEYSPLAMTFVPPSQATAPQIRDGVDFLLMGAVYATRAVLPAMRERGQGALFYTSGRSSLLPMKLLGSLGPASTALRHYIDSLHEELAGEGIRVGTIPILTRLDRLVADRVAATYLEMLDDGAQIERVIGEDGAAKTATAIAELTQAAAPLNLPS